MYVRSFYFRRQDFFVASSPPTSPSYLSQVFHSSSPGGPLAANAATAANTTTAFVNTGATPSVEPIVRVPAGGLRPHPERMARPGDMSVTLDPVLRSPSKKHKPKWHLGIRSQSKPLDIMDEVYKVCVYTDQKIIDLVPTRRITLIPTCHSRPHIKGHETVELRMEKHYSVQHSGAASESRHFSTRPHGLAVIPSGSKELFTRLQESG